jgi:hypothetical protein
MPRDDPTIVKKERGTVDPTRRKRLTTGVAATAIAARQGVFAQEATPGTGARFYEKGSVRIAYQEAGSASAALIAGGVELDAWPA